MYNAYILTLRRLTFLLLPLTVRRARRQEAAADAVVYIYPLDLIDLLDR